MKWLGNGGAATEPVTSGTHRRRINEHLSFRCPEGRKQLSTGIYIPTTKVFVLFAAPHNEKYF